MGNRSRHQTANDNLDQPDHMILRQSVLRRIKSKDSGSNTFTSANTRKQPTNESSPKIPRIIRMSDVKAANIISVDSDNNPKMSSSEAQPTCKLFYGLIQFLNLIC